MNINNDKENDGKVEHSVSSLTHINLVVLEHKSNPRKTKEKKRDAKISPFRLSLPTRNTRFRVGRTDGEGIQKPTSQTTLQSTYYTIASYPPFRDDDDDENET
jgi:hypothetical protein